MPWDLSADPGKFEEALRWLIKRKPVTKEQWLKLTKRQQAHAFTVAGLASAHAVAEVQAALVKALSEGLTLREFQKVVEPKLLKHWGGTVKDPAFRIETIFRNAVQTSYNRGRVEQMRDPLMMRLRPYWMFDAARDDRTTHICKSLDGAVEPADSSFWEERIPPLHHNCRSSIISLREKQAKKQPGFSKPTPTTKAADGFGHDASLKPDLSKFEKELKAEIKSRIEVPPPMLLVQSGVKPGAVKSFDELPVWKPPASIEDETPPRLPSGESVADAKRRLQRAYRALEPRHVKAIKDFGGSGYQNLRPFQQNPAKYKDQLPPLYERLRRDARDLEDALRLIPGEPATLYRGVSRLKREDVERWLQRRVIGLGKGDVPVLTSTSLAPGVGYRFSRRSGGGGLMSAFFIIHSRVAKLVFSLSPFETEYEVIFSANAWFAIRRVARLAGRKHTVVIELEHLPFFYTLVDDEAREGLLRRLGAM